MAKERLDKIIASQSMITRSEAWKLIKSGQVKADGLTVKDKAFKADPSETVIEVSGKVLSYKKHIYIMMNKPVGIVSASRDPKEKTVVDLVPEELKRPGLFPAGRLDKDTTGFVLITDDGEFAHNILSPSKHINKTYLAATQGRIDEKYLKAIREGMTAGSEVFMPASIELYNNTQNSEYKYIYKIILHEGRYHQIKRMISASEQVLLSLKRIAMGSLSLDENLKEGCCREITPEEFKMITEKNGESF